MWGKGGGHSPFSGRGPLVIPPLPPQSCPAQVLFFPCYLLLAWPGTAITSLTQQRPTGGPRALPLIWEPNCLWVGGSGPWPCDDTRVPLPRTGAPSPSPGAAHPLGWLMQ